LSAVVIASVLHGIERIIEGRRAIESVERHAARELGVLETFS